MKAAPYGQPYVRIWRTVVLPIRCIHTANIQDGFFDLKIYDWPNLLCSVSNYDCIHACRYVSMHVCVYSFAKVGMLITLFARMHAMYAVYISMARAVYVNVTKAKCHQYFKVDTYTNTVLSSWCTHTLCTQIKKCLSYLQLPQRRIWRQSSRQNLSAVRANVIVTQWQGRKRRHVCARRADGLCS